MSIITHTIYSDHFYEINYTDEDVASYAAAVETMLHEEHPEAEINTEIIDRVSGIGSGISSDDAFIDTERLNELAADIFDRQRF